MSMSANVTESPLSRPLHAHKKDLVRAKRVCTPGQGDQSVVEEVNYSSEEEDGRDKIETQILAELRRMNERLDDVETQVAGCSKDKTIPKKGEKLSSQKHSNQWVKEKNCKSKVDDSDSSESESDIPLLSTIRTSKSIQRQIDRAMADLEKRQMERVDQGK